MRALKLRYVSSIVNGVPVRGFFCKSTIQKLEGLHAHANNERKTRPKLDQNKGTTKLLYARTHASALAGTRTQCEHTVLSSSSLTTYVALRYSWQQRVGVGEGGS